MKILRKLFFLVCTSLLIWVGIVAYKPLIVRYNKLTDGFSVHQITSRLPPCPQFDIPITAEKKEQLQKNLKQKFYYLGKGTQFYVFESEDGAYVVKFLRQKFLRQYNGLERLPMPQRTRHALNKTITRHKLRVEHLFSSCKLAYEKMPEETALIFIHLNRTAATEMNVTLVDKLGLKHTIAIDDYEFCVQKKGVPLKEIFAQCESDAFLLKVQQLINLLSARCAKGICDRDPEVVQNTIMIDDQAIFADFGEFYEDSSILSAEEQTKELHKRLERLRSWTEVYLPAFSHLVVQSTRS